MGLKLFYSKISPPSRAVAMIIKALKLKDVEYRNIDILSKKNLTRELKEINPQQTVPTLKDDEFVLWDSHVICSYLVNKFAKTDSLYPRDYNHRAIVDQRLHFDSGVLYPTVHRVIFPVLFQHQTGITNSSMESIHEVYGILETLLAKEKWIAGYKMTIADFCCIASISTLDYVYPVTDEYPSLKKYLQRCSELPYYREANQDGLDILGNLLVQRITRSDERKPKKPMEITNKFRKMKEHFE